MSAKRLDEGYVTSSVNSFESGSRCGEGDGGDDDEQEADGEDTYMSVLVEVTWRDLNVYVGKMV